jgi:predicted adenylyl cyclase CyaB
MAHINIEIKAKSNQHERIRRYLHSHHALHKGTDHQIDTYFNTPNGRLKLREGNIENTLIHYERNDQEGPKKSRVILYHPTPNSSLKELLVKSNGIKVVVDKIREIYFIENVKFHLDKVEKLGTFVEIEAIQSEQHNTEADLQTQCEFYMKAFEIKKEDLISVSYSDMMLDGTDL